MYYYCKSMCTCVQESLETLVLPASSLRHDCHSLHISGVERGSINLLKQALFLASKRNKMP